jgi:allantoin racemase
MNMPAGQNCSNFAFRFGFSTLATLPTAQSGFKGAPEKYGIKAGKTILKLGGFFMKIQLLVPGNVDPWMEEYFHCFLPQDVDLAGISSGGVIESRQDLAVALPEVLEAIVAAEKNGYDAVFTVCLSDTGVEQGRELVNIPVMGTQLVSMHVYAMLGHNFTVFAPNEYIRRYIKELIHKYDFDGKATARALKESVMADVAVGAFLEYRKGGKRPDSIIEDIADQCILAIEEDDAEVLGIGCGALVWAAEMVTEELEAKGYDIPVLNPYKVVLEITKAFVKLGLNHGYIVRPPSPVPGS